MVVGRIQSARLTVQPDLSPIIHEYLDRSHAPYSGRRAAAVALLSDGSWVPGVRVENASFSLTLPAVVNAVTTALAMGRTDIVAVHAPGEDAIDYVAGVTRADWTRDGQIGRRVGADLPDVGDPLPLQVDVGVSLETARALAERAVVPESDFPVAALLVLADRSGVPGVNVEVGDWTRILCAERNVLGSWVTRGRPEAEAMVLSCPRDASGSPCGACRQWLVELVPDIDIIMDRGDSEPVAVRPSDLLPGAFTGRSLRPRR